jgi:hypothetical protein
MPLVLKDRVLETSVSAGTSAFLLAGAVQDFQPFSTSIGGNNTTFYTIVNPNTGQWETGLGTLDNPGTTLTRTTIYESSTGGTAVNFSAGTKLVFCDYLASKAVYLTPTTLQPSGVLQIGTPGASFPNALGLFYSNVNNYAQLVAQNTNSGTIASTDLVATANNGDDTQNYVNVGITSSTYADAAFTILGPNDSYLLSEGGAIGGDLAIGTGAPAHSIKFFQGGTLAANEIARFAPTTNNLLVGTIVDAGSRIRATGIIESTAGGFKFPDGTVQPSANVNFKPVLNGIPIGQIITGTTLSPVSSFNYTFSDATVLTTSNVSIVPSAQTSVTLPPISTGTVLGLTGTITFSAPHNLAAGNTITISGASPAGWNGTWVVAFTNPTVVTITFVTAPGNYVSGATVTTTSNSFGPVLGGDELEMDGIMVAANCTTAGTVNVYVTAANNALMVGNRTFNYSIT